MPNSLEFPLSPWHIIPLRHFPLLAHVGTPFKCRYCNLYMYKSYKTVSQGLHIALKERWIACCYPYYSLYVSQNIRSRGTTWQIPVVSINHVIIIRSILTALDGWLFNWAMSLGHISCCKVIRNSNNVIWTVYEMTNWRASCRNREIRIQVYNGTDMVYVQVLLVGFRCRLQEKTRDLPTFVTSYTVCFRWISNRHVYHRK